MLGYRIAATFSSRLVCDKSDERSMPDGCPRCATASMCTACRACRKEDNTRESAPGACSRSRWRQWSIRRRHACDIFSTRVRRKVSRQHALVANHSQHKCFRAPGTSCITSQAPAPPQQRSRSSEVERLQKVHGVLLPAIVGAVAKGASTKPCKSDQTCANHHANTRTVEHVSSNVDRSLSVSR